MPVWHSEQIENVEKCTNLCMDNLGERRSPQQLEEAWIEKMQEKSSVGGICCCSAWFHSLLAGWLPWQEIDAISGAELPACYTSIVLPSLWHSTTSCLESWSKVLMGKNRKGAIFLRPTLPTRLPDCPVLKSVFPESWWKCALVWTLCRSARRRLKESGVYGDTTNGLNSQLSLDKLKTNSCSLSKQIAAEQRVNSFFPMDTLWESTFSLQQYNRVKSDTIINIDIAKILWQVR